MRTIIFLFVLTVGLMLLLKLVITPKYGEDVQSRFIERIKYIPSQKPDLLSRRNLARWLTDGTNSKAISGYVFPVLFPIDFLFLVSLGLLLGIASVALAGRFDFLSNVPHWIWWLFPSLYMASDFFEDVAVIALFKLLVPLTDGSYSLLSRLTAIKLVTVSVAIGQVGFLGTLHALLFFFPANRQF
jgi:hypothetical protein